MTESPTSFIVSHLSTNLVTLAQSSEPGASEACWQLVKQHEPLMITIFRSLNIDWVPEAEDNKADEKRQKAHNPNYSEDVRQAGWLGFLEALKRFNPEKGFSIGAFVRRRVEGAIKDAMREDARYFAPLLPLTDFEEMPSDSQEQEIREAVQEFMASLTPRQRRVVELVGLEGMKQADAARELGISREAVNKLWQKACDKGRIALSAYASNVRDD